jgi:putative oxidoreductase
MNDLALLISRVLLVLLFLVSAFGMFAAPSGVAGYFGSLGVPAPGLTVWIVIAWKLIASILVLIGLRTRWGALALAVFCIAAPLFGHLNFADQNEVTQLLKDFAIAGGFLALAVAGPGRFSVSGGR